MHLIDEVMLTDPPAVAAPTELTVTLRTQVSLGGVEYTELQLTEPKLKQLIAARKAGIAEEQMAQLIHLNAKVPMVVVQELGQRDFEECADFFVHISDASRAISGT